MRVSSFQLYRQFTESLHRGLAELFRRNEQIATGKRINRPSDDVIGAERALDYRVAIDRSARYRKNVDNALSRIGDAESALSQASDALARLKELALTGATGTQTAVSRAAIAEEVRGLRDHLLALANTRLEGRYLFSGFRTNVAAFDAAYSYQGDGGILSLQGDEGTFIPSNVTGGTAFGIPLAAEETVAAGGGMFFHYIPGGGTAVDVEIRAADDTTVLDRFRFENMMQLSDLLAGALANDDEARVTALVRPFEMAIDRVSNVRADLGGRMNRLDSLANVLEDRILSTRSDLSRTEDADIAESASELAKADAVLQALRASSARILPQSLLDFLG